MTWLKHRETLSTYRRELLLLPWPLGKISDDLGLCPNLMTGTALDTNPTAATTKAATSTTKTAK